MYVIEWLLDRKVRKCCSFFNRIFPLSLHVQVVSDLASSYCTFLVKSGLYIRVRVWTSGRSIPVQSFVEYSRSVGNRSELNFSLRTADFLNILSSFFFQFYALKFFQ